jgi:hypothetical protein
MPNSRCCSRLLHISVPAARPDSMCQRTGTSEKRALAASCRTGGGIASCMVRIDHAASTANEHAGSGTPARAGDAASRAHWLGGSTFRGRHPMALDTPRTAAVGRQHNGSHAAFRLAAKAGLGSPDSAWTTPHRHFNQPLQVRSRAWLYGVPRQHVPRSPLRPDGRSRHCSWRASRSAGRHTRRCGHDARLPCMDAPACIMLALPSTVRGPRASAVGGVAG